jgi:hypothetical protein
MEKAAVDHYGSRTGELAARYEPADVSEMHRLLVGHLPARSRVSEMGSGAGRDDAPGFSPPALMRQSAKLEEPNLKWIEAEHQLAVVLGIFLSCLVGAIHLLYKAVCSLSRRRWKRWASG